MLGQPFGTMHGHYGLASTGTAQHSHRAILLAFHQAPLRRVQKNPPFLQRLIEHLL
ncbi:hypothetical protein D3C76_1519830 [compost metagenome]